MPKQAEGVMRAGDLRLNGEEILEIAEFFAATAV